MLVSLSQTGNRDAYAELVARRQTWIRNLMRRCSGDRVLADDLSQQVFLQAWRSIRQLSDAARFAPWLKRMAINMWLQYKRRDDPLRAADQHLDSDSPHRDQPTMGMDLDKALGTLTDDARLCVVLSYHERMTHAEIEALTGMPMGTVKSHIRRGTIRLREELSAYLANSEEPT